MSATSLRSIPRTVLIVDDDPGTRGVLAAYSRELGLVPEEAENGVSALSRARHRAPDLILLDVEMPVMNGRDTLVWLKDDRALRDTPVIMISGINDEAVALQCIEAGAEDFIKKPADFTLLRARVLSSLERVRLREMERIYLRQVETHGLDLEQRVREKTRELTEAHKRLTALDRAKDDFLRLISHELRTPMTGIVGASEALTEGVPDEDTRHAAGDLLRESVARLARVVEHALLLTSINVSQEVFHLDARTLKSIVTKAARQASLALGGRPIPLGAGIEGDCSILCDERLLTDALAALLECASKFAGSERTIQMESTESDDVVKMVIRVPGGTIPAELIPRFFEIFSMGAAPVTPGGDLGLGPPVAFRIIELLGGSLVLEIENGITFVVCLQRATAG